MSASLSAAVMMVPSLLSAIVANGPQIASSLELSANTSPIASALPPFAGTSDGPASSSKPRRSLLELIKKSQCKPLAPSADLPDFACMTDQELARYLRAYCYDAKQPPPPEVRDRIERIAGGAMLEMGQRYHNQTGGWSPPRTPTTITWSFVPDGLMMDGNGPEPDAPSNLMSKLDGDFHNNRSEWVAVFFDAMNRWSMLTGIHYQFVSLPGQLWDDGAAWGAPGAPGLRGDMRIGGHHIDGPWGTVGYNDFPPPFANANAAGDMCLDTSEYDFSGYSETPQHRTFLNLISHENGHGQGMFHVCPANGTKLMEPALTNAFYGPQHDDVRGGIALYGDALEPNNTLETYYNLGALPIGTTLVPSSLPPNLPNGTPPSATTATAIDGAGDEDYFKIYVPSDTSIGILAIPAGYVYENASQSGGCPGGSPVNSGAQAILRIDLLDASGNVLAGQNATGLGGAVQVVYSVGGAATYYVRMSATNEPAQPQMYALAISAGVAPAPGNDACANAEPLVMGTTTFGANYGATTDGVGCSPGGGSADVWYTVTPDCSGTLRLDTCDSSFDTVLSISSGSCGALTEIACNDDSTGPFAPCSGSHQSFLTASVNAGQTYYVRVASYWGDAGTIQLRTAFQGPANDDCENATIVGSDGAYAAATCGATTDGPTPNCVLQSEHDIWYVYAPSLPQQFVIDTSGSSFDTVLTVYTGACGDLTEIACHDDVGNGDYTSRIAVQVTPGNVYRIRVGGFGSNTGNVVLHTHATQPNDLCANAPVIQNGSYSGTTYFAGREVNGTCNPAGAAGDVWYRWVAPCTGSLLADTCGSPLDTVLGVYTGSCGGLFQIACNDDANSGSPCPDESQVSFVNVPVTEGTTYFIRVAGYGAAEGPFNLRLRQIVNDACTDALPLSNETITFNTTCAQPSTGLSACGNSSASRDIWYAYTATCSGTVNMNTCGSTYDTVLSVYSNNCAHLPEIACNDDVDTDACPSNDHASNLSFNATSGTTYLVRVSGYDHDYGSGRLTASCQNECPCDWNASGAVNSQDYFDFLQAFFSGRADFNHSGATNSQDFFDFIACFFTGC